MSIRKDVLILKQMQEGKNDEYDKVKEKVKIERGREE